ncbi:MAG: sigma-70 family RNA polymerase sigma factor [Planctomycetota bacterium]
MKMFLGMRTSVNNDRAFGMTEAESSTSDYDHGLVNDIRLAVKGDQEAWMRLFAKYREVLAKWADDIEDPSHLSQRDLIQDAWLKVFKGLGKFRGADSDQEMAACFYVWLRTTVRRAFLSTLESIHAQKRKPKDAEIHREIGPMVDNEQSTPSSIVMKEEQNHKVVAAVENLEDPLDRQIIKMFIWEGLSLKTIASVLGMDYTKLRRRHHLILAKLGSEIGPIK